MQEPIYKLTKKQRKELRKVEEKQQEQKAKKFNMLKKWGIIISIIVVLFLAGFWLVQESSKPLPGTAVMDQGRDHVSKEKWEKFEYSSNPSTSGPHDVEWIKKGIYDTPQRDGYLIHSLEHGYVVMHYNCAAPTINVSMDDKVWVSESCTKLIQDLTDITEKKKLWKLIVVPNPAIPTRIAVVAWNRIARMNSVERETLGEFIDVFRDRGPEQTMEP